MGQLNDKPFLPRFTENDFGGGHLGADTAAKIANERLEEFEKTCTIRYGSGDGFETSERVSSSKFGYLQTPPVPIKRGVSKAELIKALRIGNPDQILWTLADRIEREGIIE